MKNVLRVSTGVILGFLIGALSVWLFYRNFTDLSGDYVADAIYTRIVDDVTTLTLIRREEFGQLLDAKEQDLSMEMVKLSSFRPLKSISDKQLGYLMMVIRYSEKHSLSTGDADLDSELNGFLREIRELQSN